MSQEIVYKNTALLYELVKGLVNRETAFIAKDGGNGFFRNIKAHKVEYLIKNMKAFQFEDREMNIYHSVAILTDMPMFSWNPKTRKEQSQLWNDVFLQKVVGFDFVVDIDNKGDFQECYRQTKELVKFYDSLKVPYYIKFSGNGFHVIIPYQYIPCTIISGMNQEFLEMAKTIKEILDLSLMDIGIYDDRRIIKANYSYDFKSGRMCVPLDIDEFEKFVLERYKPENYMKRDLRNQGIPIFNYDSKKNFDELRGFMA